MSATSPPRSALALLERPLFLLPAHALALAERAIPGGRDLLSVAMRTAGDTAPAVAADYQSDSVVGSDGKRPYALENGIATIPVYDALANRTEDAWFFGSSYEGLRETIGAALDDPECKAILLDVNSPGGEAAGAMETSAFIRMSAGRKPCVAFVDGMACSAAYALACGAQEIVAAPSATLGSIGVVTLHLDVSKMLDKFGVTPTLLHSGKFKTDGFPTKPLESDAAQRIQATLDEHYSHFTTTVGANRPMVGAKGARKTEAGVFVGSQALSAGLVDAIGDRNAARAVALARVQAGPTPAGGGIRLAGRSGVVFAAIRTETMTVHLYGPGRMHANSLVDGGKVDKEGSWSFSAEDGDKLLGANGDDWSNFASFHLGEDDSESEKTKARYKYPFGKDGKVYRSGVIAAKSRAAQQGVKEIEDAAAHLLEKIDGTEEKQESRMADQEALAAAREEGRLQGVSQGQAEGVKAERIRIGAILSPDVAKSRIGTALVFALETDMSAEVALKALAATPATPAAPAAPAAKSPFDPPRLAISPNAPEARDAANDYERGAAEMAAALGKKIA